MKWLKNIFSKPASVPPKLGEVYVTRGGRAVKADEAFFATNSSDLQRMLAAAETSTTPVDRHFLLQNIVGLTYKLRKDSRMRDICLRYGLCHISEFPSIKPFLIKEMGGILPRVSTFQKVSTLLVEEKDFTEAIKICQEAINLGLEDGTQSGFAGRITRIERKQASDAAPNS